MSLLKNRSGLFLLVIILVGSLLRFYNYSNWSLSNDELSALMGLTKGNFNGVIGQYVRSDFHPAGVEVFLFFWTKIFGISVASVRLPFILAGIFSILLSYLIASRWFNKYTGLLVAAGLATLEYTVLYSQLARPYSFGLLFSLMLVSFWTEIIFSENSQRKIINYLGFIFSMVLCMYNHYFSFLFAGMVGITGLFFLNKEKITGYLLCGILAVLLFMPHLSITFEQFSNGGVGEWLAKPGKNYFLKYLFYCFNDSWFLTTLYIFIFLFLLFTIKKIQINKFQLISLIWFFVPFTIGYYYSLYVNPVLQYSILIFSFPFLLIFIFSFADEVKKIRNLLFLLLITLSGVASTVYEKGFYHTQHFGVFKELSQKTLEWNTKYKSENITRTINIVDSYYINYYLDKLILFETYSVKNEKELKNMMDIVEKSVTPYFMFGWSNCYNPYEVFEIIRRKYPVIVEDNIYFNSQVTLFKQGEKRIPVLELKNDFEKAYGAWNSDTSGYSSDIVYAGNKSFKMDSIIEFSPILEKNVKEIYLGSAKFVNISIYGYLSGNAKANLVISFESDKGQKDWTAARLENFIQKPNSWGEAFLTKKIPDDVSPGDIVKIYVWNSGKKKVYIDDLKVSVYEDSNYEYRQ